MDIVIPTTKDKIFKQYLYILNPILSIRKLTHLEIEVLSTLLYIDDLYRKLPQVQRNKLLFNKDTKERVRQLLNNLSKFSYNNVLTSLRKKKLVGKKELNISVDIINNEVNINYKLKLA